MRAFKVFLFILLTIAGWGGARPLWAETTTTGKMELVRVAANQWTFEKVPSGERFIPFGANLVFRRAEPQSVWRRGGGRGLLNVLVQREWKPEVLRETFKAARSLHMNVMKVFLPSHLTIPDPQTNGQVSFAKMDPPLLERLDTLFQIARENQIYISLSFAEWGAGDLNWWQDGGTFLGRGGEAQPEIDSYAVLRNFWKALAERYKNEPALFSYNLAVEYYMPSANWDAQRSKDPKDAIVFNDRWGLPAWRQWLKETYGDVEKISAAWETQYKAIGEIPQPQYEFVSESKGYSMPQAMLADYHSFREVVSTRFLKNQVDAIRAVDKRHMITAGVHPHHPAIGWVGSSRYHAGVTPAELEMFDYTTVHVYTMNDKQTPEVDIEALHYAENQTRFAYAGKPVIVEEMGHYVPDRTEVTNETIKLARTLAPHASGFMLWCLTDSSKRGAVLPYGPLNMDLTINVFGEAWRKLAEPGGAVAGLADKRAPAAKVVTLDRVNGLAPIRETEAKQLIKNWDSMPHPVDFKIAPNPGVAKLNQHSVTPEEGKK